MYETTEDVQKLQALLDRSHEEAGEHLRSLITPERRITAADLVETLTGMRLLSLATVTARCEPRVGPVDGLFYRGQFWFGSSPTSVRFTHIRARPQVSATHTEGEALAVTVHGRATMVDLRQPEHDGFRRYCLEIYGGDWEDWGLPANYARIDADRMFTADFSDVAGSESDG